MILFKRIFGSEENKDVLLAFLNETLKDTEREPLSEIVLLNPNLDKDSLQDKMSILDVRVKTKSGKYIDIEMQLFNQYDIEKRSLYLWAKLYEAQLSEGQKYKELNKCITINILNYLLLPDKRYHSIFQLREITTYAPLIDDVELHFIELPKLHETAVSLEEGLVKWLLFLKGTERERWEVLAMNEPQLRKAMDTLEFLSQNEEARRLYEMRQKALHDEASMLYGAREEGKAEGREEGKVEGKTEVARNMLAANMPISLIAKFTGLSEDEVEKLKEPQH